MIVLKPHAKGAYVEIHKDGFCTSRVLSSASVPEPSRADEVFRWEFNGLVDKAVAGPEVM